MIDLPVLLFQQASALTTEERLFYLLVDLAIIIVMAQLLGAAARSIGQPPVLGKIVAGIVLGPTILGKSLVNDIFPAEILASPLKTIADVGIVFFMFLVGAELDIRQMRGNLGRSAAISFSGIALPAVLGFALGYFLLDGLNADGIVAAGQEAPERVHFALFLAAAMCITAFPVLAAILKDTFLYKIDLGRIAIGAAAVDDVCAWILLAVVVSLVHAEGVESALTALVLTAVFATFMFTIGRRALELLARRYDRTKQLGPEELAAVVAVVLISAGITEIIGIEKIFGAFLAGVILPRPAIGLEHGQSFISEITKRVESFTEVIILPVFFLLAGLSANLLLIDSASLIGWLLLIIAVAVAGKFIGCTVAARLSKIPTRDSIVIGSLMNTRGLTELVILHIGLTKLGVISEQIFAMMLVMALTTTFMASPIVNRLMPRREILARIAEAETPQAAPIASRILVATSNLLTAPALAEAAWRLTGSKRPAEVILARLIPVTPAGLRSGLGDEDSEIRESYEYLRRLEDDLQARGISARTLSFETSQMAADLLSLAESEKCDRIVLPLFGGPTGMESNRQLITEILRAKGPELVVVGDQQAKGLRRDHEHVVILQAAPEPDTVTRTGLDLAAQMNARVTLLGFVGAANLDSAQASKEIALLADRLSRESRLDVTPGTGGESPAEAALSLAREADVVVMPLVQTSGGGAALSELFWRVSNAGAVPVIGVRPPSEADVLVAPVSELPAWPFLPPAGVAPAGTDEPVLPLGAHLQRMDPWGRSQEAWPLEAGLAIGRELDNRVALPEDKFASRHHARIERSDGHYEVEDLDSTNGTLVWRNDEWLDVTREDLTHNDLIIIGSNVFRYSDR